MCGNEVGCIQSAQLMTKVLLGQELHSFHVRIQSVLPNTELLASGVPNGKCYKHSLLININPLKCCKTGLGELYFFN